MSAYQPFAFEREFTAVPVAANAEEDLLAAAFTAAEARGFASGQAAALAQHEAERASAVAAALAGIAAALDQIEERSAALAAGLEEPATGLAIAAAELLAGRAMAEQPTGAVRASLAGLLGELRRGVPLELWVHPELVAETTATVEELQRGERRQRPVTVKADPALALGDARIGWDVGFAKIDAEARRAALGRALAGNGQGD